MKASKIYHVTLITPGGQTVFVHEETKDNQTVWVGFVDVFELTGHKEVRPLGSVMTQSSTSM
jgi:hypothetical protein